MLPFEPQSNDELKARFPLAVETPVEVEKIQAGIQPHPSKNRKHVFDYEDGMRLIISIDQIEDTRYFHVSASGTEEYGKSIEKEGFEGFVEDVFLRICVFRGRHPGNQLEACTSKGGVLHIMFEDDNEGLATGS